MALGGRKQKNSPSGGTVVKTSEALKNAQKTIENVVERIKYNDFKDTVEKIIRANNN